MAVSLLFNKLVQQAGAELCQAQLQQNLKLVLGMDNGLNLTIELSPPPKLYRVNFKIIEAFTWT